MKQFLCVWTGEKYNEDYGVYYIEFFCPANGYSAETIQAVEHLQEGQCTAIGTHYIIRLKDKKFHVEQK